MNQLTLTVEQAGQRADQFLAQSVESLTRSGAQKLLEQGIAPIEAAAMTGFADQSHFTNYFKDFIGLTPKQYQRIFTQPQESANPDHE